MPSGTLIEVHRLDGRPVLTKTATTAAARTRLDRETDRLQRAGHPGVVELIEVGQDPDLHITLAWAGVRTLETMHPPLPVAAALLASLAETVADLHALDIIHGRIDASHVIVDGDGRPRLCGLAGSDDPGVDATDDVAALGLLMDLLIGAEAEPEPIPERRWARRRWTGFARRSLQTLADQANHPEPEHRPTARQLARSIVEVMPEARLAAPATLEAELNRSGVTTETLVGKDAIHEDPIHEDSIHEDPIGDQGQIAQDKVDEDDRVLVRAAITETFLGMRILDDSHDPGEPEIVRPLVADTADVITRGRNGSRDQRTDRARRERTSGDTWRHPRRGSPPVPVVRVAKVAVPIVIVLLLTVVAVGLLSRARAPSPTTPATGATASPVALGSSTFATSTTTGSTPARSPSPGQSTCPPVTGPAVKLDDGCAQAVQVQDTAVRVGSAQFRIGRPGDHIAVGDWNCDGQATPAIVRPSSGEVFVFTSWAGKDDGVTITPAAIVSGATMPTDPQPGSCGPLRVRRANGTEATVSSTGKRR